MYPVLVKSLRALLVLVLYIAGLLQVQVLLGHLHGHDVGWDARAYYDAWDGELYEITPGEAGAYNYSPLFAQLIWPLVRLPWPVFCALAIGAAAVGVLWLVLRARPVVAGGLVLVCLPEILSGNIYWLMAIALVCGVTRGTPWLLAAFTKILPTVGPLWFLLRGEWRPLLRFTVAAAGLLGISYAAAPELWHEWVTFLQDSSTTSTVLVFGVWWPLWLRVVLGIGTVVAASVLDRPWLLAVAMVVMSPVVGAGTYALLAAIPRLLADGTHACEYTRSAPRHERHRWASSATMRHG